MQQDLFGGPDGHRNHVHVEFPEQQLETLAAWASETAEEKGFWEDWGGTLEEAFVSQKLLLIVSEAVEAMEAIRKNKGVTEVEDELADVFIRLIDLYGTLLNAGLLERSFSTVVTTKMAINSGRARKHGNRF